MIALWFGILCFMLTMFAVLEGWDFGGGAIHLLVARTAPERREVIAAIGPLWSWHEVWLVGAGGTFMVAFPAAMAAAFSGYYLALWLALWSFMLRGVSIEVGGHLGDPMWQRFWDVGFTAANVVLAVVFGAALGNVIRGVPIDATGRFSLAFFTDFGVHGQVGILDWYTICVAVETLVLLCAHGATYLVLKTTGAVHDRSARLAGWLWLATALGFPVITLETWLVRPELFGDLLHRPLGWVALAVVVAGAAGVVSGRRRNREARAMVGSALVIVGLLAALAVGVFPVLLRSTISAEFSVTADQAASSSTGLAQAIVWWPIAFALAIVYFVFVARQFRGKVRPSQDPQGDDRGDEVSTL
jgi:cytochrome d ubiquinol oxidase subunit II